MRHSGRTSDGFEDERRWFADGETDYYHVGVRSTRSIEAKIVEDTLRAVREAAGDGAAERVRGAFSDRDILDARRQFRERVALETRLTGPALVSEARKRTVTYLIDRARRS